MTDEQIIDVTKCIHFDKSNIPNGCNCYWDGECNHYCYYKKYIYEHQECEKLKQTLAKIKEIAKDMNSECFYSDFDCKDCDMKNGCIYQGRLEILQKISEVHNEQK